MFDFIFPELKCIVRCSLSLKCLEGNILDTNVYLIILMINNNLSHFHCGKKNNSFEPQNALMNEMNNVSNHYLMDKEKLQPLKARLLSSSMVSF